MKKRVLLILFLFIGTITHGQAIVSQESLKAAFIFQFIKFVQWTDEQPEYYICIPDDEAFRKTAQEVLQDKSVNDRKLVVVDRLDACHVLVTDHVPVTDTTLTIGPLAQGALFEFRVINNKLKFLTNPENIKKSKLKISSQLLKLAILENDS